MLDVGMDGGYFSLHKHIYIFKTSEIKTVVTDMHLHVPAAVNCSSSLCVYVASCGCYWCEEQVSESFFVFCYGVLVTINIYINGDIFVFVF
jgi:hypothetical protein